MLDQPFSRRRFLALSAALSVLGSVSCERSSDDETAADELDDFIQLSSRLTGFPPDQLDRKLAQTYLAAIREALPAGATMQNPPDSAIEETMICWYSGTIPADSSQRMRVVTYDQALAWKSITWTQPNFECRGVTGFWSDPPSPGVA